MFGGAEDEGTKQTCRAGRGTEVLAREGRLYACKSNRELDSRGEPQVTWETVEPSLEDGEGQGVGARQGGAGRPHSGAVKRAEEQSMEGGMGGLAAGRLHQACASGGARRRAPVLWFAGATCQRWGSEWVRSRAGHRPRVLDMVSPALQGTY